MLLLMSISFRRPFMELKDYAKKKKKNRNSLELSGLCSRKVETTVCELTASVKSISKLGRKVSGYHSGAVNSYMVN